MNRASLFFLMAVTAVTAGACGGRDGGLAPPPSGSRDADNSNDADRGVPDAGLVPDSSSSDAATSDASFQQDAGPTADAQSPADASLPVINPLPSSSFGTRCRSEGGQSRWLVLSAAANNACEEAAKVLKPENVAYATARAELPETLTAPGVYAVSGEVCLTPGSCAPKTINLEVTRVDSSRLEGRWWFDADGARAEGTLGAQSCSYDDFLSDPNSRLASGLNISEIAIYQGVKVPLMQLGVELSDLNAPVVAKRPGILRVFVRPDSGWSPKDITGRLTLTTPGAAPVVLEERVRISGASAETDGRTTFNFGIEASHVDSNTTYSVALYDLSSPACRPSSGATNAVFPSSGSATLRAQSAGAIRVVLVPVRYNADGTGRLPDTSATQLAYYRNLMLGMYPVSDVELTVRAPLEWPDVISPNGAGWSEILDGVLTLRARDRPPAYTYYYGIFVPTASFGSFCRNGCVLGLGPVPRVRDELQRGAVGVGFSGEESAGTFVHEIGHALGRLHAPCQTRDADAAFPYPRGAIGVYGYDFLSGRLFPPTNVFDMMGYCDPAWISDYTYSAIFQRLASVNNGRTLVSEEMAPRQWRTVIQDPFGIRWGQNKTLTRAPMGTSVDVRVLDADGALLRVASGHEIRMSHLDGRFVLLPDDELSSSSFIALDDGTMLAAP